jgi:hypothetical protein
VNLAARLKPCSTPRLDPVRKAYKTEGCSKKRDTKQKDAVKRGIQTEGCSIKSDAKKEEERSSSS